GKVYAFGEPLVVSISPSSFTLDVGQSQQFNSTVSGGTSPYSYQWYLNGTPVSGATSDSWNFTPTSIGFYTVYVNVTDSLGAIAISTASQANIIPEFQSLFLTLFITATLLLLILLRKNKRLKRKTHALRHVEV
ncbi:MAG: PKD domain-containing protein, partial [Candidatus Bathyarchaeia archaeon]